MRVLFQDCTLVAVITAFLICAIPLRAGQDTTAKVVQSGAAESYPNTADGLHSLLSDLLIAAKNDEQIKLSSKIAEMEIPNYEAWFPHAFGPEKGPALAVQYQSTLKLSELQFAMLCNELAKQQGEISIGRVDRVNLKTNPAKADDALVNPSDIFAAEWTKTDASAGPDRQPIGYFYFVDGRFRLNGFPHESRIVSPTKPGPLVSAKLIKRVPPVYPEAARQLKVQGLVALNVVIHKDGTVTVQNVGAGHPLLAQAAIAAVEQWTYSTTTVSGEPVEVQTKIYVTFQLTKQPSDQK